MDSSAIRSVCGNRHCRRRIARGLGHRRRPYCGIDDLDRLLRSGGKSTLDLLRRKDAADAPDAVVIPGGTPSRRDPPILRRPRHRGRPVRRRHQRGRRTRPGPRRLRRRRLAGPAPVGRAHDLDNVSGIPSWGGPDGSSRRGCLASTDSRSGTSRRASSSPPSAASRPPGRRGRPPRATGGSTTWSRTARGDPGRCARLGGRPHPRRVRTSATVRRLGGMFGVITRVRVRVHPVPEATRYEAGLSRTSRRARRLCALSSRRRGPDRVAAVRRGRDGVNLATTENIGEQTITGGCLAITMFEGTEAHAGAGTPKPGPSWWPRRHVPGRGPARLGARPFRRAVPARLAADAGALCETLETATNWARRCAQGRCHRR